jgi:hypothetical protein
MAYTLTIALLDLGGNFVQLSLIVRFTVRLVTKWLWFYVKNEFPILQQLFFILFIFNTRLR